MRRSRAELPIGRIADFSSIRTARPVVLVHLGFVCASLID